MDLNFQFLWNGKLFKMERNKRDIRFITLAV